MSGPSQTYTALLRQLYSYFDWHLREYLRAEGEDKSWTLAEIQDKFRSSTGVTLRKSTIFRRNTELFQQYQCSPLRRVDSDRYALDPVYYAIAGNKVRPPPSRPGRPRQNHVELD